MFAAHYRLGNLFVLVDYNHYADHGDVDALMNLQPFEDKWDSFGWETTFVKRGNDVGAITNALRGFREAGKPKCLIELIRKFWCAIMGNKASASGCR